MKSIIQITGRVSGIVLLWLCLLLPAGYHFFRLPPSNAPTDLFRGIEIAHRGGYEWGPENALPTILLNLDRGVQGIEVDVQLSSDGVPVLFHDSTLARITGLPGKPGDYRIEDLAGISLLDENGKPSGAHIIPLKTLLDTLVWYPEVVLELDLKHFVEDQTRLVTATTELVKAYHLQDRVLFSTFDPTTLYTVRKMHPELITGYAHTAESGMGALADWVLNSRWVPQFLGVSVIEPHHELVDEAYVDRWHGRGLVINAWTANEAADKMRLRGLDITFTSNCPGSDCEDRGADNWGTPQEMPQLEMGDEAGK